MGISMPKDVRADECEKLIWKALVPKGNTFTKQDVPALRLLCFWHHVAIEARAALVRGEDTLEVLEQIGYKDLEDISGNPMPLHRKHPALAVLKEATTEIRALSELLNISPKARVDMIHTTKAQKTDSAQVLQLVLRDRAQKQKARRAC
ncbi:P27 family phage terminase small subunit [Collinsella sp. zg1085]|uniref:P27 family phage terminase small subunit n=1 Tax=Collinsella sp. zg1085 TaxID=2844380 RepID=UPI001C0D7D32|nr:P27 family phage terminase small subunit [Collinsella sp. zg1085]QWT18108.1 P27 family phage terminase small subunit [Collinsella sp. zg1085]